EIDERILFANHRREVPSPKSTATRDISLLTQKFIGKSKVHVGFPRRLPPRDGAEPQLGSNWIVRGVGGAAVSKRGLNLLKLLQQPGRYFTKLDLRRRYHLPHAAEI